MEARASIHQLTKPLSPVQRHDLVVSGLKVRISLIPLMSFRCIGRHPAFNVIDLTPSSIGQPLDNALPRAAADATRTFVEIVLLAEDMLGRQDGQGLDGRVPIELMTTGRSGDAVKTLLGFCRSSEVSLSKASRLADDQNASE